jgi:PAS domain S-box-containing protein
MQQPEYYSYLLDNNNLQDNSYNEVSGPSNSLPTNPPKSEETATSNAAIKGGTDFRRRKNWSERILVEITGLLHVLSPAGKILYCSESTHELTGYRPHELVGQALMDFLHVDDMDVFIRDFQMSFHTRSQIKTHYRFRKKDDTYIIFEVVGQPKSDTPGQPPQSFFGIAQPIPTKSGALIDTFLELKAENNWLKKRIDELSLKYGNSPTHQKSPVSPTTQHQLAPPSSIPITSNNKIRLSEEWLDSTGSDIEEFITNYSKKESQPILNETNERKDKWKRRVNEPLF